MGEVLPLIISVWPNEESILAIVCLIDIVSFDFEAFIDVCLNDI